MVMIRGMPGGRQLEVGSATGWPCRAASLVLRYFSAYSGVNGGVSGTPGRPLGSQVIAPTRSQMPVQLGMSCGALLWAAAGAASARAARLAVSVWRAVM